MTVRLYAFECGHLEIPHAFLWEGAKGKITVPIPSYLIVNSHLHYDHADGNALLPNADILVQEPEWDHACGRPDDDVAYRKMEAAGGRILFGHDPDFWKTIPQAAVRLA